ncbi:MAG: bifunctional 2-C-methyl-D-erythritol 4-phosphate cytidylyltransferase/2-C-methyl-D-erythritol 2,4-cyclodiphosphate synthase [Maricaulaceae bacterium]
MTKNALILVAAGRGERAGGDIPKQYRLIAGKPLLAWTLEKAIKSLSFDEIRVVVAETDPYIAKLLEDFGLRAKTVVGGETRTTSVHNGLKSLNNLDIEHVYIHDGARPFVSRPLLSELSEALKSYESAVPVLPIADALKTLDGTAIDRDQMRRMQTPQAFHYDTIAAAFDAHAVDASFADDISVAKHAGLSIAFTQGDEQNFKVTYPDDFNKAERILMPETNPETYSATGSGFDVHQFDKGDILWLCGIPIECGYTLKGHSDADAGLHALTDAILGAIAHGDIGDHFPPSDPQWKGASSDKFLLYAVEQVAVRGGKLQHVDVTLICEKPKIKPHREAMREKIAELCGLPLTRVSVKATTTEKLGFTGRGEGLAAQAVATVTLPDS